MCLEIQPSNRILPNFMIRRISTSPHETWSIAISSNQLYVGTYGGGIVLIYQNESLINKFNGCIGNSAYLIPSILFDPYGYMGPAVMIHTNYIFSLPMVH